MQDFVLSSSYIFLKSGTISILENFPSIRLFNFYFTTQINKFYMCVCVCVYIYIYINNFHLLDYSIFILPGK